MTSICLDGHNLALPTGSGIATYARSLIQTIQGIGLRAEVLYGPPTPVSPDPLLREVAVSDARLRARALTLAQPNRHLQVAFARFGRTLKHVEPSGRVVWPEGAAFPPADGFWLNDNLFRIASRAYSDTRIMTPVRFSAEAPAPAIMHWTYPAPVVARGVPNVYTIHDLIPLKLPHTTLDDKRRYLDLCTAIARKADHIVTVSEATRRDVIELLGVDEDRVTTTWQTVDIDDLSTSRDHETIARELEDVFDVEWKGYFLFFGAIEPKKNLRRLVEAYLRSGVKTPLLIVGGKAWLNEEETGFLDELITSGRGAAAERLRRYDYLPRSVLLDLIRGARATFFPSLYEGFGLPVLESMVLGTPVLASNAGSLPEIAGDAAVLVDPYNIEDMARAITALDADEGARDEHARLGRLQADQFTPDAYRCRVSNLYRKLGVSGRNDELAPTLC